MLEVHPPHHTPNTWRDFFIHVATICIGLLIAIGLEQTVEAIHHHQLHQLREDLHAEGLRNLHIAVDNIRASELRRNSGATQFIELIKAGREHRPPVTLPPPSSQLYIKPAYAVWTVAQQSGTAGLLPRQDAQHYVRLYSIVLIAADQVEALNALSAKRGAAMVPSIVDPDTLKTLLPNGQPFQYDLALLSPEDLRQVRDVIAEDMATARRGITRSVSLYGVQWSVLHGPLSDEETIRILYDALEVYKNGGTAALLAKYPLPDSSSASAPLSAEDPH